MYKNYELLEDKDVIYNTFFYKKIKYQDYCKWFYNDIKNKNCIILVAEYNGQLVGRVRFEVEFPEDFFIVVSIYIHKDFRGHGIAKLLINEGINKVKFNKKEIQEIKAFIKIDNIASIKLFEKSGFIFLKKGTIDNQEVYEYIFKIKKG